jgi:hypothetical protein
LVLQGSSGVLSMPVHLPYAVALGDIRSHCRDASVADFEGPRFPPPSSPPRHWLRGYAGLFRRGICVFIRETSGSAARRWESAMRKSQLHGLRCG